MNNIGQVIYLFAQSQQLINFNFGFKNISSYNIPNSLNRNIRLIFEIFGEPKREIYIVNGQL